MLQSVYMNSTMPVAIKTELDEIKSEVRNLKDMMTQLMRVNTRLIARLKGKEQEELDYSDMTPDELMLEASRVFNVTSAHDPDDDLIAPDAVIKPIDWSGYA
jgi:hypothetical protein